MVAIIKRDLGGVMDEEVRYQRQAELIPGWDQGKLKKTKVTILGSDNVAWLTAVGLVALGIGNLRLMDNKNKNGDNFLTRLTKGSDKSKVALMTRVLTKINNSVEILPVHSFLVTPASCELLGQPDILIDTTDSTSSKSVSLLYGKNKGIPVMMAGADNERGQFQIAKGKEIDLSSYEIYAGKMQGFLVSEVLAGLICDEVRKIIIPLEQDAPMQEIFYYNINAENKFAEAKCQTKNG